MKKLAKFFLMVALVLPTLASCNKEDEPQKSVLATIIPYWNNPLGFAIQLDNGETMWPNKVLTTYEVKEEAVRAFIVFTENSQDAAPFTYNVDIHGITEIETKDIELVASADEELGNDGIQVVGAYIGGDYLNVEFVVNIDSYSKDQKHVVSLIDNHIEGQPEYTSHYPLELRFKRDHKLDNNRGQKVSNIVCFRIGEYDLENLGCNGYEIKFKGLENKDNEGKEEEKMYSIKITPTELI